MNGIILTIGLVVTLVASVAVPTHIAVKYAKSRGTDRELSIAKVIFGIVVWLALSVCMLVVIFLCSFASEQADKEKKLDWMVLLIVLGSFLCYVFAGYVINYWVRRREKTLTLIKL